MAQRSNAHPLYKLIRDSCIGYSVHQLSGGRFLRYPEDEPGYVVPDRYLPADKRQNVKEKPAPQRQRSGSSDTLVDAERQGEKAQKKEDDYIVDWHGDDDPDNPQVLNTAGRH